MHRRWRRGNWDCPRRWRRRQKGGAACRSYNALVARRPAIRLSRERDQRLRDFVRLKRLISSPGCERRRHDATPRRVAAARAGRNDRQVWGGTMRMTEDMMRVVTWKSCRLRMRQFGALDFAYRSGKQMQAQLAPFHICSNAAAAAAAAVAAAVQRSVAEPVSSSRTETDARAMLLRWCVCSLSRGSLRRSMWL